MGDFPWWILLVVVAGGLIVYVLFMIFLPEWVGITGRTALRNEQSHREGSEETAGTDNSNASGKPPVDSGL